ncbi:response regulator, partial [Candidatus Poribacteria bacterium]|nr:response regulator [Candidatus Poribacteria bacterium]
RLNDVMRGELDVACLSSKVISEIATYLDAQVGAFYMLDGKGNGPVLSLLSSYAYTKRKNLSNEFKPGEGLVGQAALEKKQILVSNVPEEYVKVTSGLGEASPRSITVTPFLYESRVSGVVEIGTLGQMSGTQLEYLSQAMNSVAINVETARGREELAKALKESRALAEKLQVQQEELKAANEELEEQTQMLQQSEEKLKLQQEELKVANEELEEKNESLERQKSKIEQANKDLERTRKEIETKAEELGIASKYKSEFLANMSHELRTPLNSLLLLARLLADNKEGNLSKEQMESAGIIYNSGNDLLSLLNEILDLSKIEAGRMDVHVEPVSVATLAEAVRAGFEHVAADKGLSLEVTVSENAPAEISTDRKRLEQIIKNLMSNAIKFTEKGAVTVNFGRPDEDADLSRSGLVREKAFAISVKDTGIGISPKDQKIIFEAFQQAEGGSSRKFGGTGLGLTISRELAALLGGEIQLESEVGKGTVFTVCLPLGPPDFAKVAHEAHTEKPVLPGRGRTARQKKAVVESVPDDRECVKKEDKVILIVEDDPNFARLLQKQCHDKGFKCLASATGEGGLELAEKYSPAAIVLDLKLPGIDGWTVLDSLKENPKTRHIPVHIMSVEDATIEAFRKGAVGYLTKPAKKEDLEEAFQRLEAVFSRRVKDLIVVEDDGNMRKGIIKLVGNGDVYAEEAATGGQALQALKSRKFDCMILDLGLPDMTGFELLKALEAEENVVIPPVIVYTGKELTHEEEMELRKYSESIIIKGVRSEERLLDESSLFLHRMVDKLPENMRKIITNLHDVDIMFKNRRVMIVDDDMRNVFALTSVLEQKGVSVLKAENGQKALEMLLTEPKVDLVLMDIMMPVMDGYETMKRIRAQEKFQKLPIIALTAKAMREDRERSITAGASDYLTKPVDVSRLCSMMRVWLYK